MPPEFLDPDQLRERMTSRYAEAIDRGDHDYRAQLRIAYPSMIDAFNDMERARRQEATDAS